MSQLIGYRQYNLTINNPTLAPFASKLIRTINKIPLTSSDKCITYFNSIANPKTTPPDKIKLRRKAEDKILRKLY